MERFIRFLDRVIHVRDEVEGLDKTKYEPLIEGSDWRLLPHKMPKLGVKFDKDNPETYERVAYHPATENHWFLSEQNILQLREMAQNDPLFDKSRDKII